LFSDARLKSLFLYPAVGLSLLIVLGALVMSAISTDYRLAWLGTALTALPLPLIVGQLKWRTVARTSEYLPLHVLLVIAGLVLAARVMYENFVNSWVAYRDVVGAIVVAFNPGAGTAPGFIALFAAVLFLLYLFWYSRFGRYADARLDVGSKLPEFEVHDLDGNAVKSTDMLGVPCIFLFYRGNWCPLCRGQIDELVERRAEFEDLNANVCLISSQSAEQTRELANRLAASFHFLVDTKNRAAQSLGIAVANGVPVGTPGDQTSDTVLPTLFVTSAGGTIVFSDQTDNYRVRPEPDIFLALLRRARANAA